MSACSPKYKGRNSPPYPHLSNKKRRGTYSHYYLSRAYDPDSPPSRWIKNGEGDIAYRKPRRKTPKKSRRKRSRVKKSPKKSSSQTKRKRAKKSIRRSKSRTRKYRSRKR